MGNSYSNSQKIGESLECSIGSSTKPPQTKSSYENEASIQLSTASMGEISIVPSSRGGFQPPSFKLSREHEKTYHWLDPLHDGVPIVELCLVEIENGATYEGEWNTKGLRHGRGIERMPDGSLYIGYFLRGKKEQFARVHSSNGTIFEGQVSGGLANGRGWFFAPERAFYKGFFRNSLQHGVGTERYVDGSVYEGEYEHGQKHGKGTFQWKSGKKYTGEFRWNKRWGRGKMVWPNGARFKGEWKEGFISGRGTYKWPDGSRYEGNYEEGQRHGHGKLKMADGTVYKGIWNGGDFEGKSF